MGAPAEKATTAAEARLRHSVWMRRELLTHPSSIVDCNEASEPSDGVALRAERRMRAERASGVRAWNQFGGGSSQEATCGRSSSNFFPYITSHEIGIRNRVRDQCTSIKVITVMQMMHRLAIIISRPKACLKPLNSVKC
jgi:hypothetical protein